ncbi:hypothetical protein E2562_020165 [Oryza meyeriana var. granulata]|uniref:CCHC-type domain-containing protein n=1 Tax=Oryza meyeriana var. granulata TaxID=110450 RepID=A0A6G1BMI4_9ORYZ|nr:hypothetical protein E2562_020165 [Oryza meyeriana var. granulata]
MSQTPKGGSAFRAAVVPVRHGFGLRAPLGLSRKISKLHRAAACRRDPRYFHCRELGHRSYVCPLGFQEQRAPVWIHLIARISEDMAGNGGCTGKEDQPCRWVRKQQASEEGCEAPVRPDETVAAKHVAKPKCVIDRTVNIGRMEDDLR